MTDPYVLWSPTMYDIEENGQWGYWSPNADALLAMQSTEVHTDPTYTLVQILREHSVLLRSKAANRHNRPAYVFDFTEFDKFLPPC